MRRGSRDLADVYVEAERAVRREDASQVRVLARAIGATSRIIDELGLGRFLGPVRIDEKPRLLLRFERGRRQTTPEVPAAQVVLKVYGDADRGEGPALRDWRAGGVPMPRSVHGEVDGVAWILLEHLSLSSCDVDDAEAARELTRELARCSLAMHRPASVELAAVLRPASAVLPDRLRRAHRALRDEGRSVATRLLDRAAAAYSSTDTTPQHGDLAPGNLGRRPDGSIVLYDPSALAGPRALDAVRWGTRVGTRRIPPADLLDVWRGVEHLEDVDLDDALLGAELIMEAGSRAVVRARSSRPGTSDDAVYDSHQDFLLALARQRLG